MLHTWGVYVAAAHLVMSNRGYLRTCVHGYPIQCPSRTCEACQAGHQRCDPVVPALGPDVCILLSFIIIC